MPENFDNIQFQVFGVTGAVFPGHPITVAYLIMKVFPSWEAANHRPAGDDYKAALTHSGIPGAGGCVHAALDLLKRAVDTDVEAALAWGAARWRDETQTSYKDRYQPGQDQADSIASQFRELFKTWPHTETVPA